MLCQLNLKINLSNSCTKLCQFIQSVFRHECGREFAFVRSVGQADEGIILMFHDSILVAVRDNGHGSVVNASDDTSDMSGVQAVQSIERITVTRFTVC